MEASEFLKLAKKLNLDNVTDGQGLQGSAHDISRFLHAGDPGVDHLFLGVYGAMMAANLDRVCIDLGASRLPDDVMNGTQVRLEITEDTLTLTRLPVGEAAESSPGQPSAETLSDGGRHE